MHSKSQKEIKKNTREFQAIQITNTTILQHQPCAIMATTKLSTNCNKMRGAGASRLINQGQTEEWVSQKAPLANHSQMKRKEEQEE